MRLYHLFLTTRIGNQLELTFEKFAEAKKQALKYAGRKDVQVEVTFNDETMFSVKNKNIFDAFSEETPH